MKIIIKSRDEIQKMACRPLDPKTALISIADYGWRFAELKNKPDFLLQLAFDDVDNDIFYDELGRMPEQEVERAEVEAEYHMITDEQAAQIADFYNAIKNEAGILICQCEHGQSRSAAVAAAILEYRCRKGITVFAHDRYYPNKAVFQKVLTMLQRTKKSD